MVSVTAALFKSLMNLPDLSDENAEYLLDQAIDMLNIYGANISNLSGDPGSVTVTSKERGGIFVLARNVYQKFYKRTTGATVGGLSTTDADLTSDPDLMALAENIAHKLVSSSVGVAFRVGEDTSGIE